jgi:7,8-dihydroneopterin aldolase/epimerase/oxygenase
VDLITIRDLEVHYHVGVPDAERAYAQRLLLSVVVESDFTAAARGDDLGATIDYYAVSQRLLRHGEGRSWKLIERLAVELAELIVTEFGAPRVTVEVKKFILPEARHVAVQVTRGRPAAPDTHQERVRRQIGGTPGGWR